MKKKILSGVFALALLITAGYGVNKSVNSNDNANFSYLALNNVEALAQGEGGDICNWATRETWQGWEAICIVGGPGYLCQCGEVKPYY